MSHIQIVQIVRTFNKNQASACPRNLDGQLEIRFTGRVYGHTTTAMHDNEYTPPPVLLRVRSFVRDGEPLLRTRGMMLSPSVIVLMVRHP